MNYVLAHECSHKDHDDECKEVAYLHEETADTLGKVVKVFTSKRAATAFISENKWRPDEVMVIPEQEMT